MKYLFIGAAMLNVLVATVAWAADEPVSKPTLSIDFTKSLQPAGELVNKLEESKDVESSSNGAVFQLTEAKKPSYLVSLAAMPQAWSAVIKIKLNGTSSGPYNSGSGRERYFFRMIVSGTWGDHDVLAGLNSWGKLLFSQFDDKSEQRRTTSLWGNKLFDNKVHSLAFVFDKGTRKIYFDGSECSYDENDATAITQMPITEIRLGALIDPTYETDSAKQGGLLDGYLQTLSIFPRALTSDQIKQMSDHL